MQNQKLIMGIILLFLVGGFVYYILNQGTPAADVTNQTIPSPTSVSESTGMPENVKTFEVEGKPFEFMPNEIRVKKGDTVKIVFKNTEGFHSFIIDGLAKTKQIPVNETDMVQFVATQSGTFEYYCDVGTHRQQGMVGKLIVEE